MSDSSWRDLLPMHDRLAGKGQSPFRLLTYKQVALTMDRVPWWPWVKEEYLALANEPHHPRSVTAGLVDYIKKAGPRPNAMNVEEYVAKVKVIHARRALNVAKVKEMKAPSMT